MYNGDSAEVSIQYSFLPSWISTITDQADATSAGKALFNAVYDEWSKLPTGSRPKLIAYGLSLGSFACQAAFTSAQDIRDRADGAFFAGTPNFSQPWRAIEDARAPPVPSGCRSTRRARRCASPQRQVLRPPGEPVERPAPALPAARVGPGGVVEPHLFVKQPDWLKEPRAPDVSPQTTWFPVVTFLQVTVDQFYGTTVPNGYGHNYGDMSVAAWSAIAPPPGWTAQRALKLQASIDQYRIE